MTSNQSCQNKSLFIHTEELVERYPDLTPKERENAICKEFGAVFFDWYRWRAARW